VFLAQYDPDGVVNWGCGSEHGPREVTERVEEEIVEDNRDKVYDKL
jgi:hypothetical protein